MRLMPLALVALLALPASTLADWRLAGDESSVHFVSVKKENIAEKHYFKSLSGGISDDGQAELTVDLASVETNIPIRNERMQTMLFETAKFAQATISTNVDAAKLKSLKPGQTMAVDADMTVQLHGEQKTETVPLQVTALNGGKLMVSTGAPIIVSARDFKLLEGIDKLREVAGLKSISPIVPVTATLMFTTK